MSNFKIIAIKTGDRFNIEKEESTNILLDPIKILNYNTVYSFYSDYGFPNNDFNKIIDNSKEDELYSLKTSINNIPVNINAIVGSNGSGKSTLIELLYWINYNIGCQFKLLKNEHDKLYKLFKFLELEILYSIDDGVFVKLKFEKGKIYKQLLNKNKKEITPEGEEIQIKKITDLSDFFYTVVINYSHYSLNSLEVGKWITPLFHKNDGYQTPIVLNPMRTDGKIDINRERHLLTRRLLANILEDIGDQEEEDSLRNLVNGKIANKIKLTYNSSLECNFKDSIAPTLLKEFLEGIKTHFNILVTEDDLRDNVFLNASLKYIFQKLDKVARVYRPFKKHIEGNSIKWLKSYFEKIKYSNSHIVFKIKGAILFLKYFNKITEIDQFNPKEAIILKVDKYSNLISKIDKQEDFWVNTFMLAPPPLFDVEIIPKDESSFEALSSGEKQRIHSISSIVYHLINLNSVEQQNEEGEEAFVNYSYINIVLDEIELYYHPDWQRRYICDLLEYIGKINPLNLSCIKGVNITFLTHSPFILSDIPNNNIIRLLNGQPQKCKSNTFGANIHELLTDSFFITGTFMGEFAKREIEDLINFLTHKERTIRNWDYSSAKNRIHMIGDNLIKSRLNDLLNQYIESENDIQSVLKKEKEEIESRLAYINKKLLESE